MNVRTTNSYSSKGFRQNDAMVPFCWRLSNARSDAGYTQNDLGSRLGVSQPLVSSWEKGKSSVSPDDVVRIVGATGKESLLNHYCAECPVAAARKRINHGGPKPA